MVDTEPGIGLPPDDAVSLPWLAGYPARLDWAMPLPSRPVADLLVEAATAQPDHVALDFLGRETSYGDLLESVNAVAGALQQLGLTKGSRFGLMLPNSPFYVVLYFAVLKVGGVVVNINPLYAEREIANMVADAELDMLATLDLAALYDKVRPLLGNRLGKLVVCQFAQALPFPKNWLFGLVKRRELARIDWDDRHVRFRDLLNADHQPVPVAIDPDHDLAVLQYTGGTTGTPKGAMLSHANIYVNCLQAYSWLASEGELGRTSDARQQPVMMGVLPFFHVFAMTVSMNLAIHAGARIVLMPRFELDELLDLLHRRRVTLFPAVPSIYNAINHAAATRQHDLSSIRICLSGGAPLPVEVKQRFEQLTGCRLVEGYGLSETSPVACVNPLDSGGKPGSIGLPVPGTIIEIVSLDDHKAVMPVGELGEVCVRGPQVMKGYWRNEAASAQTLRHGRLHTGDVGYMDSEGYTFIVDRIKDMILVNGYNVYPRNIEEAIYLHDAVEECLVAGIKDERRGEVPKAWIKLRDGVDLSEAELRGFLKDKLSPIELPRVIEFRTTPLPKTLIGKLSRKDILAEDSEKQ